MGRVSKVVSVLLTLSILGLPAIAATFCADTNQSGMNCPPDRPMMAKLHRTNIQFKAASESSSCCEMSSAKPAPRSELQAPASSAVALHRSVAVGLAVAPEQSIDETARSAPPDTGPAQSRLCTFLI